jgi:hypothetical protein
MSHAQQDDALSMLQRLKRRILVTALPALAEGIWESRRRYDRTHPGPPCELAELKQEAQTALFQLLIDRYAESRGLRRSDTSFRSGSHVKTAIDALTIDEDAQRRLVPLDYARLPIRFLGSIHESLLEHNLEINGNDSERSSGPRFRLAGDKTARRRDGAYYTPEPVIQEIVKHAVGPVLAAWLKAARPELLAAGDDALNLQRRFDQLFQFRLLDPAMGSGHFLVAAANFIAERLQEFVQSLPESLRRLLPTLNEPAELKRQVTTRCLYGVDLNPLAAELARASLWLNAGGFEPGGLKHLKCGDALLMDDAELAPGFQAIIGNPPYGATLAPDARRQLKLRLPQMKHNADTAVGFIERSSQLLSPEGRCGLIVPKPLTYSFAWRHLRRFLEGRIVHLVDMSRVWNEVRLEQVILVFDDSLRPADGSYSYRSGNGNARRLRMPRAIGQRFDCLPCALDIAERRKLAALRLSDATVGDLCQTFRGLPLQRELGKAPAGALAVIGGRDLQRWRVRSVSGYVRTDVERQALAPFKREKLLFQNIIAHVARPRPHILLIGSYDRQQRVTLDTVNNLVPRAASVNLHGVLGLLHSELVNWFVYSVVYNRAIRTMHFDQYFLDKIPLPPRYDELLERLASLALASEEATEAIAQSVDEFRRELQAASGIALSVKAALKWLQADQPQHPLENQFRQTIAAQHHSQSCAMAALNAAVDEAYFGA